MMHVIEKFEHLKVALEAIKLATHNFAQTNHIGGGGFGKVYKGEVVLSGIPTIVALKRLDPKFGQGNPEFWKEIVTLSLYKHDNIVSLLGFCDESDEKILVYEYASKGSLDSYLNTDDLKWSQRLKICIGAARGLAYLHDAGHVTNQRVLHRDIKSSNILLDENWNARISDLGLSKFGPANQQHTFLMSNAVGTIGYCDPVYVATGLLTKETDVYSFGVVLFEVLCGRLSISNTPDDRLRPLTGLVRQHYEDDKIRQIIHASIKDEIKFHSLQVFTSIAYKCISIDLKERPLMTKVLSELERALQYQDQDQDQTIGNNSQTGREEVAAAMTKKIELMANRDNGHISWQHVPVTEKMKWREEATSNDKKMKWREKASTVAGKIKDAAAAGKEEAKELADEMELALEKAEVVFDNWWDGVRSKW